MRFLRTDAAGIISSSPEYRIHRSPERHIVNVYENLASLCDAQMSKRFWGRLDLPRFCGEEVKQVSLNAWEERLKSPIPEPEAERCGHPLALGLTS
jgi:hypothetical protein